MKIHFVVYTTLGKPNKKPLFTSAKYRESLLFFKEIIETNRNIVFPLKYVSNFEENKPQKYFLVLAKILPSGEKEIIKISEYFVEERFFVYVLKKKLTFLKVLDYIVEKYSQNFTKVIRLKNKIIFDDGQSLDCILTKNLSDCKRFYFLLKNLFTQKKINSFLFLGHLPDVPKKRKSELIKRLVELTGLSHYQFKRNSTRH